MAEGPRSGWQRRLGSGGLPRPPELGAVAGPENGPGGDRHADDRPAADAGLARDPHVAADADARSDPYGYAHTRLGDRPPGTSDLRDNADTNHGDQSYTREMRPARRAATLVRGCSL